MRFCGFVRFWLKIRNVKKYNYAKRSIFFFFFVFVSGNMSTDTSCRDDSSRRPHHSEVYSRFWKWLLKKRLKKKRDIGALTHDSLPEDPLKTTGVSFLSEVPENGHSVCIGRGKERRVYYDEIRDATRERDEKQILCSLFLSLSFSLGRERE